MPFLSTHHPYIYPLPHLPSTEVPLWETILSTEYPCNKIFFSHKNPKASDSGNFQYKKSHFGKKWPNIDQNCEKNGGFFQYSTVFLLNGPFILTRYQFLKSDWLLTLKNTLKVHRITSLPYSIHLGKNINVKSHSKVRSL